VQELIGADTVNTMPPATMNALRDHRPFRSRPVRARFVPLARPARIQHTPLRKRFRASASEQTGLVTISAHSLRAYNPATMWLLDRGDRRTSGHATSDLLERIQRFEREHAELRARLEGKRQLRILRRRSSERRMSRRSSVTRSRNLLRRCERRYRADALAESPVLEARGDTSTAPSCRNHQNSKAICWNMNATREAVAREH